MKLKIKMNSPESLKKIRWIFTVSRRFSKVDKKGRTKTTSFLASLGIAFGVMTLIVVMSIMNGFQMSFIDSIQEISSFHIRVTELDNSKKDDFIAWCNNNSRVKSVTPFYEAQGLLTSNKGHENIALIRAINPEVYEKDEGFRKELKIITGEFDLGEKEFFDEKIDSIIIGSGVARQLGVTVGNEITLFALSGGNDVALLSNERKFLVKGIFSSGYTEINSAYVFVSDECGRKNFGKNAELCYGVKLHSQNQDAVVLSQMKKVFPDAKISSWRQYNKSFFGTLRLEKNMLLMLVALIFIVVAVNIYNGMRRIVFERMAEIQTLSALGARTKHLKLIFVIQGLMTGIKGSLPGLILGLLISYNSDTVFRAASKVMYAFSWLGTAITNPANLVYVAENPMYNFYAQIPARVFPGETFIIVLFGLLAPLIASTLAGKNVIKMTVAEVLHNE